MSPTQRSLKLLRDRGYLVAITERWNPFAKLRQDLFGWIDLLAIKGNETLAVQTTTAPNMHARLSKIKSLQSAELWMESPNRKAAVHGWKKPNKTNRRWACLEVALTNHL